MQTTGNLPGAQSSMIPQIAAFDTQSADTFDPIPTASPIDSRLCNFES